MAEYEVPEPIINSPFPEPGEHWYIREGEQPEPRPGRRPAIVYSPRDQSQVWDLGDGILRRSPDHRPGFELVLVNPIRQRVAAWRTAAWPGVTRTSLGEKGGWHSDPPAFGPVAWSSADV